MRNHLKISSLIVVFSITIISLALMTGSSSCSQSEEKTSNLQLLDSLIEETTVDKNNVEQSIAGKKIDLTKSKSYLVQVGYEKGTEYKIYYFADSYTGIMYCSYHDNYDNMTHSLTPMHGYNKGSMLLYDDWYEAASKKAGK